MIIANNCIAADLYFSNNKKYDHPFMWCVLLHNDLLNLIKNFTSLNYNNYKLIPNLHIKNAYDLIIDNKVRVQYLHYLKDNLYSVPTKTKDRFNEERNISYNNIEDYIIKKFNKRQIKDFTIKPIILIHLNKNTWQNDITEDNITDIIYECKKHGFPLIIFGKCNIKPDKTIFIVNKDFKYPFEIKNYVNKYMKELLQIAFN